MQRAIEERKLARRFFSSAVSKLEESLVKKDKDASEINFANLTAKYEKLSAINNKVLDIWIDLVDRDESEYEEDIISIEKYDDKWFLMQKKYKNAFDITNSCKSNIGSEIQESCAQDAVVKNILRLPKLQLPRYDGDVKKWIGFWGMFQKIHEDSSIDNNMKFQYLLQSMEPGSPAAILVESFPPSSVYYQKAIKQLKERYGRDDLLIEIYVRELLSLVLDQSRGSATPIGVLYDKLKTQLHALDSLNVTTDKYAFMLRPLVESAMPIELLRIWERTQSGKKDQSDTLNNLLNFIKQEVENEERIKISHLAYSQSSSSKFTASCLTTRVDSSSSSNNNTYDISKPSIVKPCIFCDKPSHVSSECTNAMKMNLDQRKEFLKGKRACFICLKSGHITKTCRKFPKCIICTKRHYTLMCDNNKIVNSQIQCSNSSETQVLSNQSSLIPTNTTVLLQTLKINLWYNNKTMIVRALLDSGAQHSYIKSSVVNNLKMKPCGQVHISHSLFGGVVTKREPHNVFQFIIKDPTNTYECNIKAIEKMNICNDLPKLKQPILLSKLKRQGVVLNDIVDDINEVSILIGADIFGSLFTGRMINVDGNLVAMETTLGWTIQGPISNMFHVAEESLVSLSCTFNLEDLWSLETIGIKDEPEVRKQTERKRSITIL